MEPVNNEVVGERLDHLQKTMDEMKLDVREIKDGAPIWRIQQLEIKHQALDEKVEKRYSHLDSRWGRLVWFLALAFIALIGSYLTAYLTR